MRKILEERLENAKLDYQYHKYHNLEGSRILRDLECEINIYQDCLNLLPPARTEQEILDDFEELGWFISIKTNREIILRRNPEKYTAIWIDKLVKEYLSNAYLSIQEHKLLNELFEVIFND